MSVYYSAEKYSFAHLEKNSSQSEQDLNTETLFIGEVSGPLRASSEDLGPVIDQSLADLSR